MSKIVKLIEPRMPGVLLGKEVVDRNSVRIGICQSVILDLEAKKAFLLVASSNYLFKIPLDEITSINDVHIKVNRDFSNIIEGLSSKDTQQKLELLKIETFLLSKLLMDSINKERNHGPSGKNIARLFHLI